MDHGETTHTLCIVLHSFFTNGDSPRAPASVGALQFFDLRSDTESVLLCPDVPRNSFGEDVESVDEEGEIW